MTAIGEGFVTDGFNGVRDDQREDGTTPECLLADGSNGVCDFEILKVEARGEVVVSNCFDSDFLKDFECRNCVQRDIQRRFVCA